MATMDEKDQVVLTIHGLFLDLTHVRISCFVCSGNVGRIYIHATKHCYEIVIFSDRHYSLNFPSQFHPNQKKLWETTMEYIILGVFNPRIITISKCCFVLSQENILLK